MNLIGHVDVMAVDQIAGWAGIEGATEGEVFVEIWMNGRVIAKLCSAVFRKDLLDAGIGNGCRAFRFNPSGYLRPGINEAEVRFAGTTVTVRGGRAQLINFTAETVHGADNEVLHQLLDFSQQRWKGSEEDRHLTWGNIFTGDSFVDALLKHYAFDPGHRICEIGPGYGRILQTILERKLPFLKYTGVELSRSRVRNLNEKFGSKAVEFIEGDVNAVRLAERADLVFCSSTFEHLFPDCTQALNNLASANLNRGARVAIDFIQIDPEMARHEQGFESGGSAFIRVYSAAELANIFPACGFTPPTFDSIVLGQSDSGRDIRRIFVAAAVRD